MEIFSKILLLCVWLLLPVLITTEDADLISQHIKGTVNSTTNFIKKFNLNASVKDYLGATLRFNASVERNANLACPVLFIIQQGAHVESFDLPKNNTFYDDSNWFPHYEVGKTICILQNNGQNEQHEIILMISTCDDNDISFEVYLDGYSNSYIKVNDGVKNTVVSPASSRFYPFKFFDGMNDDVVLVEVSSPKNNATCMTVSVQSPQCPVSDQEDTVHFKGKRRNYWQTMTTVATMPITKSDFPNGFVLVFVVHPDDARCKEYRGIQNSAEQEQISEFGVASYDTDPKLKNVQFRIITNLPYSGYLFPISLPLVFYFALIGFALCLFFIFYKSSMSCSLSRDSGMKLENRHVGTMLNTRRSSTDSESMLDPMGTTEKTQPTGRSRSMYDTFDVAPNEPQGPCVADLVNHLNCRKLAKNSHKYYWLAFTVAVFYCVPVFQLLNTYKEVWKRTGDNDLCYYNYKCAHPLWGLVDFNHIYSNIGYVLLGLCFILFVNYKQKWHVSTKETIRRKQSDNIDVNESESTPEQNYGTIQHFGIYYALGFALIMEGVLSAGYHVCPNRSNFQFDMSFMYVIAVLFMVKIYQFRHPVKINANATFAVLAVIAIISVLGLLVSQIIVAIIFSVIHLLTILYMQIYMYYVGYIKDEDGVTFIIDRSKMIKIVLQNWKKMFSTEPITTWIKPRHYSRVLLPILTVPFNVAIIFMYFFHFHNFATHLLYIFVGNLIVYLTYYIIMKFYHGEFKSRKSFQPLIYIPLNLLLWILAMHYFTSILTSWEKSPAESREENAKCSLMNFYDFHDTWHFLSAGALFCSFMMLLTLEDLLEEVPQANIRVF